MLNKMWSRVFFLMLAWALLWAVPGVGADPGPLSAQNRFPLHFLFLTPRPVSAQLPAVGAVNASAEVAYSSVYFNERSSRWEVLLDLETTVVDLSLSYGLTSRMALRLDVPLVSMNSGFMDGFLERYPDALGVGNYGRENRPRNDFAYRVAKDGRPWIEGEGGSFRWADMTLSAQWELIPGGGYRGWSSSVLARIKLPTGSVRRGYGSGSVDAGLFWPSQWSGEKWTVYVMPGWIWRGDPDGGEVFVKARNGYSVFLGTAYAYSDKWRWLVQLDYFSSPFEQTGISRLDDGALELVLGFQRKLHESWYLEFAIGEDPFTLAAPDFNVQLGLVWNWGQ
jgi:hypothetical protein